MSEAEQNGSTRDLMLAAETRHRRGQLDDAKRLYQRVLEADPAHVRALMLSGVLERERGNLTVSLELLQRAGQIAPGDAQVAGHLAITFMAVNELTNADAALRRAIAADPGDLPALANLGALLQHRGLLHEAIEIYRRYLELQPDDVEVRSNLANSLADAGEGSQALMELDAGLDQFPGQPLLLATRGAVLCSMEHFAEAVEPLERALQINSADDMALINLALARRRLGQPEQATEALRAATRCNPDNARATADLANLYLSSGRADESCELCEKFLLYHPDERLVLGTYPYALRAAGREQVADRLLDYERLLGVYDIDAVNGFDSMSDLNAALAQSILGHRSLIDSPVSKSTTGGAQTGELDAEQVPGLAALVAEINVRIGQFVASCQANELGEHPAMLAASERWTLRIWATVLSAGGHQAPHIHPLAWLSGVYYVALPDDMAAERPTAGCLEFGQPPARMGVTDRVRPVAPREGRLVIFPSYFYHSTREFVSHEPRISIAFDVMPKPQ